MSEEQEVVEVKLEDIEPRTMEFSDSIGNLAGALAKAQGQMKPIEKTTEGYGYRYLDLASLIEAVKKPLSENGIAYTQTHYRFKSQNKTYVGTEMLLMHESGEWIKAALEIPLPAMKQLQPAQLMGVVMTYARRYLLQSMVGLAAEEDKDGKA